VRLVPVMLTSAVTSAVVVAGLAAPAGATPVDGGSYAEFDGVLNVLPPGQSGSVDAAEAALVTAGNPQNRREVDGQNAPENFADQLEMCDALNHADLTGLTRTTWAATARTRR
jgi:hypothetical protein